MLLHLSCYMVGGLYNICTKVVVYFFAVALLLNNFCLSIQKKKESFHYSTTLQKSFSNSEAP
uniref:Uncharacterized protein n=1 Tax=Rhizophora mucronata TaxID=61149 RepID=A0A2P2L7H8_RHIMU